MDGHIILSFMVNQFYNLTNIIDLHNCLLFHLAQSAGPFEQKIIRKITYRFPSQVSQSVSESVEIKRSVSNKKENCTLFQSHSFTPEIISAISKLL